VNEERRLLISLHDVAPPTWEACRRVAERLDQLGAAPYSLFVVPWFHRGDSIAARPGFIEWLRRQQERGHEILLHGYTHIVEQRSARGLNAIRAALLSDGEEEFYHLDRDSFSARVCLGRDNLAQAGFRPRGFVAPAWLMPAFGIETVLQCGFGYTETLTRVHFSGETGSLRSPCLVFSPRTRLRLACSIAWNRALATLARRAAAMRVAIHPADEAVPRAWTEIERHVVRQVAARTCCTYAQLERAVACCASAAIGPPAGK